MEDLTVLVQLAGGEKMHVRRLQKAGFLTATDLASQASSTLREAAGLKPAAAQRLVKLAKQQLEGDAPETQPAVRRRSTGPSEATPVGELQPDAALPSESAAASPTEDPALPATAVGNAASLHVVPENGRSEPGVSTDETIALTGELKDANSFPSSFWRFG